MELTAFLLLLVANGSPILLKRLCGDRLAYAIDGGYLAPDGNPWLGSSKTFRGVFIAIVTCAAVAPIFDVEAYVGAIFGAYAMLGDLITSFVKRRLGLQPSSQMFAVDQVLEAFLPLAACANALGLDWISVAGLTLLFWLASIILSRLLYKIGIRKHPY